MNQRAGLTTTPAPGDGAGLRLEIDQQGVVGGWATGYSVIAWPESGKINRMHGDSRDRWMVGLATTNLPASLPVNPLFPPILRRTKKKRTALKHPQDQTITLMTVLQATTGVSQGRGNLKPNP